MIIIHTDDEYRYTLHGTAISEAQGIRDQFRAELLGLTE